MTKRSKKPTPHRFGHGATDADQSQYFPRSTTVDDSSEEVTEYQVHRVDAATHVCVTSTEYEHPNAVRLEFMILGGDAEARATIAAAIKIAVKGLLKERPE
jgi:hypothetical protein